MFWLRVTDAPSFIKKRKNRFDSKIFISAKT